MRLCREVGRAAALQAQEDKNSKTEEEGGDKPYGGTIKEFKAGLGLIPR